MLKYLLLICSLLCCISTYAQRTCGTEQLMEQLMSDPSYAKDHEKRKAKFKANHNSNAQRSAVCANPVTLPMAIHFQNITNPDVACLTLLAVDQVRVLNEDYQGTNADISNWNSIAATNFPGISNGETCIEFCLATQSHPTGYGLSAGDLAITFNQFTGDTNTDWSGYINIFVRDINYLGYSPLGGSGNGDGVTIDDQAFGLQSIGCPNVTAGNPYTLGRTLTHELGHYLNLDHIWGNGCNVDDGVADTPSSKEEYYNCPTVGASSCGSTDMHMNYMDYVDDPCMYMFSAGQSTVMENYTNQNLQNVINNAATVCNSTPTTPTCSDGIQNQNETGIDCGGPCLACETCTDGIQNQDETGVDCGGICAACPCLDNTLTLSITMDNYPEETSWVITNTQGATLFSGGIYDNVADGATISVQSCLVDGCYDFTINDVYGDGICCDYGNGSYTLTNDADNSVLASGATFNDSETTNFCLVTAAICDQFLALSDTVTSGTMTQQAINYITSNSTITGTANMTYHAGEYLDMTSGFQVDIGANFHGYILACSANTLMVSDNATTTAAVWIEFEKSPNNNGGMVKFNLPTDSKIDISILALDGTEVFSINGNEILKAGIHQVIFDDLQVKDGVYFCKLKTDDTEKMVKISLAK